MLLKSVALFFFAGCLCLLVPHEAWAQRFETGRLDWIDDNRETVLKDLLPFTENADVSFRVFGDAERDTLEYGCSLEWNWTTKEVEAALRLADSESLYYQVVDLHKKNPAWTIEQVKKKLKIKSWNLTSQTCPALKEQYLKFGRLCLPVESEQDRVNRDQGGQSIYLHYITYHFDTYIRGGRVTLNLIPEAPEHPFQWWAKETRRVLDGCIANAAKQKK